MLGTSFFNYSKLKLSNMYSNLKIFILDYLTILQYPFLYNINMLRKSSSNTKSLYIYFIFI